MRSAHSYLLGLLALAFFVGADAEPLRILYAEQISLPLQSAGGSGAASKPRLQTHFTLSAYGRQFDLQLEPNTALTRMLTPESQDGVTLYRGELVGIEGSWLRLAVVDGDVFGAVWDGAELYSIAPGYEVSRYMDTPLPAAANGGSFVYRLSDTQGGVAANFCALDRGADPRGAALRQFRSLLNELKSLPRMQAAGDGPLQIEVAMIADYEFHTRFANAAGEMMARVNVVDGIFDDQLGVAIIPTDMIVTTSATNPFLATDGPTLLTQLGAHRASTAEVREHGLAHLFTGKDLEGATAGIAYLDALCEIDTGAGLSEGWRDVTTSALIMAHELGHNFGAPHDGRPGPCGDTPYGYLMSPTLNYSSTFSTCSRTEMQSRIQAASCVTPIRIADVTIAADASLQAYAGETFELPFEVRSTGQLAVQDVRATISLLQLTFESAQVEGGTCANGSGNTVTCTLASLAPGELRRGVLRARPPNLIHATDIRLQATAQNDRNLQNNTATVRVTFATAADIWISSAPANVSGRVREPINFSVTLNSFGPRAARNVNARILLEGLQVASGSSAGGLCERNENILNCIYAEIPSGESRVIELVAEASVVWDYQRAIVEATAENDANPDNNNHGIMIRVQPQRDLAVDAPAEFFAVIGEPLDAAIVLRSQGVEPTSPATVTIPLYSDQPQFTVLSAAVEGGSCTVSSESVVCSVGAIDPGMARTLTLRVRGTSFSSIRFDVEANSAQDDAAGNDEDFFWVYARHGVHVTLYSVDHETRTVPSVVPFTKVARVSSIGVYEAAPVTFRAVIASGLNIRSASLAGGSCNIVGQVVTCVRASLARFQEAEVRIEMSAAHAGTYIAQASVEAPGAQSSAPQDWTFIVNEGADLRLDLGAPVTLALGTTRVIQIAIHAGPTDMSGVHVNFTVPAHVAIQAAEFVDGASCGTMTDPGAPTYRCSFWSLLPANSVRTIQLSVRADFLLDFPLRVWATSYFDVRPENNDATMQVAVRDREGDARLWAQSAPVSVQVGQEILHPQIVIEALSAVDEASVVINLDSTLVSVVGVSASGSACAINGDRIDCVLGSIEAGRQRVIDVRMRGLRAGTLSSSARVFARNDVHPGNDAQQFTTTITDPPSPPPSQGSGGGGGGGALDIRTLFALGALLLLGRMRRRNPTRPH